MAQLRYNRISKTCARGVVTELLTYENGTSDVSILQAFKACLHAEGLSGETNIHNINTFIGAIDFLSCFVELRCRQATHLMYDDRIHQVIYTLDGITSHRVLKGSALVENVPSPSRRSAPCTKPDNKKDVTSPTSPGRREHTATATITTSTNNNNGHQSDKKNGRRRYDPTRNYKPVNGQAPVLPINRELEPNKNWRSCKPMSQPQENIDETKEMPKPQKNVDHTKQEHLTDEGDAQTSQNRLDQACLSGFQFLVVSGSQYASNPLLLQEAQPTCGSQDRQGHQANFNVLLRRGHQRQLFPDLQQQRRHQCQLNLRQ